MCLCSSEWHAFWCHCWMHGYWNDSNVVHWLWRQLLEWQFVCWFLERSLNSSLKVMSARVLENHRKLTINFLEGESTQTWVPMVCLLLYVCSSMIGMLTIPWTMTAELFPSEIRGVAHSISYSMANFLVFVAVQVYRYVKRFILSTYCHSHGKSLNAIKLSGFLHISAI